MAIKYREAVDLRMATKQELTSSSENWLKFLRTASNTYKYNFSDQLLIFAQFPNAKAVAVFDVWSKTFGRKIREGEKGIGLIDDKGEYPRIKYVFDISQSSPTQPKKQQPYIWELTEENHQEVAFLLSSDKNKSIENALADTVEDTVNKMIDDYVNDLLNEDNSIEPEKFRQIVCDSVKYMVLQRCGLDTSSYVDDDIFSSLNKFSNPDVIDILGESISNISEQSLRKVEQTVKTIERRNQNERNNAQNKNDRWSRTSSVRIEHDILSDDNSGQDNWSKLHTRPRNIPIYPSSERGGRYEGRRSLGSTSSQISQGKQENNINGANRHIPIDRPLDRGQRSSGETNGTARSGDDGIRGSNRGTQSNRPNEVGTDDELNQPKSRGNSSEQSDIRITQENTVTQTAEDNSPAVFSFEQIGFFDSKTEQQSEVDKFVNAVLMKGTGTEDGKFRVNDFFSENHTEKEKIDFLKDEFGWYGRYTSSESLESQPSKGLTLTHTDKENPKNNLNIHLSWQEVAEHLDSMISAETYITEKDIAERQRHALYVLKNYSSDNPNDVYAIQKAKEILDSYNIDYNDIISPELPEKSIIDSSVDYSKDLFFLNENSEIVTLLQYNPDSNLGGQFVSTNVRYSQIQEAAQKFENSSKDFFDYIVSIGQQYISDIGTDLYEADLEKYTSDTHNFEGFTPEIMTQLVSITKNDELYKSDTHPTITCEWSESPAFEDGKTYSVAEFDSIMKQADDDWVKQRQYELDTYGNDMGKIYEAYEKGEIEGVHQGYAKTKFNVNMPDGAVHTFRQDIGDGDGGVIDFLKQYTQYSEVVKILEDSIKTVQNEFIDFACDIIRDNQNVRNAHKNSDTQNYKLEVELTLNNLITDLIVGSADNDFVINGYTAKETISFLNQYQSDTEMQKYVLDTVSENTDVVLSKIEETGQAAAKIGMAFSDKLYDSKNDFDPFVYDGSMSIEDFRKVQDSILSEQKENEKTFAEQVDDVISGKIDRFSGNLKVCNTPQILLDVGCSQLPMFYTRNHLKKAILPKDRKKHQHGLTVEQIKKIPDELISPAIIMDSLTQNDSIIVVLSDIDSENNPVIASIKPNGQGFYELEMQESNFITSIYGRENFKEFINRAINNNKILFIDKQKSQELFSVLGLEFSKGLNSLDFNTIIHQSRNIVNENIVEEKYTSTQSEEKENIIIKPENYHISDLSLGQRKPLEKYQDNITAIKTLKQLEAENRNATPEEQEILSKYTGWGGMAKVFELGNSHYDEVKGLLTNDEYAAARKSAMSAFYTSPVIIKEIYSKLSDMGFSKGKLLEPSCGVGNFIGMIPQDMQAKITGIELDSLTGRIAKKLYPEAQIQICGFENSNLKSESFDVAVGNVPFGDIRVYDKKYNKENLLIHDYFFSKSLDMVKPGGVVAFITSKGTLDKRNDTARRLLAEKAEFLGAVRLPNNAFKANAGTEVTSDIIFLQKRTEPITITSENEPLWIKTTKDENGIEMNAYFTQNPQQICGSMEMVSGQFGMESTCVPNRDTKLSEQIRNAMENIQGNISTKDTKLDNVDFVDEQVEIPDSLRTGSYFLSSDKVYFFEYGTATEVKLPKSNRKQNLERMAGLIAIRDTVRQLLEMQLDDKVTDDEIKDVQSVLSSLYDDFSGKCGRINDDVNRSIFKNDSSLPLLRSLEKFDKDKYVGKADIFTKRTVKANKEITSVPTAIDALAVSLSDTAKVNLEYMSKLTGLGKEKLIEDLQGSIYRIPNTDKYVTSDEYLSGNILKKLEEAQNAFDKGDSSLAINIQALEKAMPEKIQASDIDVRLGATWINPKYIKDFVYELLGTALYHKNPIFKKDFIDVQYSELTGNYDAVIIGHSQLAKIPLSVENQERFIQNQINELMKNIEEMKAHNGQNFQVKQAERTKANLEVKLKKLLDTKKDDTVTFEELGIDKLFLDEAHYFKNLFLSTKMTNVSGIATSDSVEKTADLYMKTQYLDEITNGKGLVFATGTPVSNTICEIYNMMKYLQSDLLKEKNLWHFDSWASTFGESVTQMELAPEGNTYRAKTRFAKFHNLPELMNLFKECADIQTADTLNLPNIPDCEIHNISCEPTEIQKQLVEALAKRAVKIHNHEVDPHEDNMPKITTDGRKIGLDQRLINPDLPDEPGTKVNACVDNVFKIWNETKEEKSTQLIFCDYSTPKKDGSFNVYDDIKGKLISKGVPSDEIAFIHDATTEAAKEELFAKVRSGEVRVLIGSTAKMGAGTNVQTKLVASHDLDAPFRPADMEQRRGRMVRQGNENKQVHLYRYCTKDTFDAYLFQMLERKQKFISQIMTSKSPQRRCDDVDEATLSYAEVKALCVGDPRIKEKMELDNEVAKLILERSGYQQEQYRLEDMAASLTSKIEILENVIPKNQNDFLYYHKNYSVSEGDKKTFAGISINGQQYTKKDEAAEALKQAYIKACSDGNNKYTPIGEYKGFEVAVMFDCFSREYKASLTREGTYYLDLGTDNFTRMDNVLEKLENTCKERIERLSEHKKSLKETNEQIGKPFYKENEYQSKTAKLAKLNAELDVDGRKDNIADIEDTKEVSQNIVQKR